MTALLTASQRKLILSAFLSPPSAWIVRPQFTGWEGVSCKKNCQRLIERGLLYANAHGDFTLTDEGEAVRAALTEQAAQ